MSQRETDSYLIERSLAVIPIQKKDKGGADLSESFKVTAVFKDLQKLVSQQQRENTRKELRSYSQGCKTSHFGYGTESSISRKISRQMAIAALITSLAYHGRMEMINLSMNMSK